MKILDYSYIFGDELEFLEVLEEFFVLELVVIEFIEFEDVADVGRADDGLWDSEFLDDVLESFEIDEVCVSLIFTDHERLEIGELIFEDLFDLVFVSLVFIIDE